MGYSPWGHKELNLTKQLNMYTLKMQCFAEFCELLQQIEPEEGMDREAWHSVIQGSQRVGHD